MNKLRLAEFLEKKLRERNISLSKLAKESRIPKATLHGWLNNISPKLTNTNLEHLERLSKYFGVSILKILVGEFQITESDILYSTIFNDGNFSYKLTVEKLKHEAVNDI